MQLTGYADKFSVKPGETIKFYVSSKQPKYNAELVRVIHGDPNPKGPGFKTEPVSTGDRCASRVSSPDTRFGR